MNEAKFIVLYGINRLGKTTQSKRIANEIVSKNSVLVYRLKYPIYELEPTGSKINAYLRENNPEKLTPLQHQQLQLQNRLDFQPVLIEILESGIWVLAEDYILTGIAWGIADGVDKKWLKSESKKLLPEDIGILFDGEPFPYREANHRYERDESLTKRCRKIHLKLAYERRAPIINANQEREKVTQDILNILKQRGFII